MSDNMFAIVIFYSTSTVKCVRKNSFPPESRCCNISLIYIKKKKKNFKLQQSKNVLSTSEEERKKKEEKRISEVG